MLTSDHTRLRALESLLGKTIIIHMYFENLSLDGYLELCVFGKFVIRYLETLSLDLFGKSILTQCTPLPKRGSIPEINQETASK